MLSVITSYPSTASSTCLKYSAFFHSRMQRSGDGWQAELFVQQSGTFEFFLQFGGKHSERGSTGHWQMAPKMGIRLDQICLISMLSKWMGPLSEWDVHLLNAARSGFNMIHWTPLQTRGHSNSPYSIYDQLDFAPDLFSDSFASEQRISEMRGKIEWTRKELGIRSMIDVVWNHTACDSGWLKEHPEAGYNLQNSPHLLAAYDLDESILRFSENERKLGCEADLEQMIGDFKKELTKTALWEYFVIDADRAATEFKDKLAEIVATQRKLQQSPSKQLADFVKSDRSFTRHSMRVVGYEELIGVLYGEEIEKYRMNPSPAFAGSLTQQFREALDAVNLPLYHAYDQRIHSILSNIRSRVQYERLMDHGPRLGPINKQSPMLSTYFTRIDGHVFTNNGFLWNADPLINFAEPPCEAYLLREVIVWGDCVKLRYGVQPSDSPWLWQHMTRYTELMASIFDAFRIDNCHSTPLHVAKHLLRRARAVRPEIYVCAELFTGSVERDYQFIKTLGLNSLIREAMMASSPEHLSSMVREYGGDEASAVVPRAEYQMVSELVVRTAPTRLHVLFAECTHDNEMPAQKRTVLDALPNAAIVAFSSAAIGSVLGYDDLLAQNLNIVHEQRRYTARPAILSPIRSELNKLHVELQPFTGIDVTFHPPDLLVIMRDNPVTGETMTLIARTAFPALQKLSKVVSIASNGLAHTSSTLSLSSCPHFDAELVILPDGLQNDGVSLECSECAQAVYPPIAMPSKSECRLLASLKIALDDLVAAEHSSNDERFIRGGRGYRLFMPTEQSLLGLTLSPEAQLTIEQVHFTAGSIAIFRSPSSSLSLHFEPLDGILLQLDFADFNVLLYRCDAEESDSLPSNGVYHIPGYGKLSYSGLQGFQTLITNILSGPDNQHPLVYNLCAGRWAMQYCSDRLRKRPSNPRLQLLADWMDRQWTVIDDRPASHRPRLFCQVINQVYSMALQHIHTRIFDPRCLFRRISDPLLIPFARQLAIGAVQLVGCVDSTGLLPDRPSLCIAAGLPYFATHHMRCWGRDTFIAFRPLLLYTGLWSIAREHLVAFGGCCFNGLIPNLLDAQRWPRYNSRDATWWWARAVHDYYFSDAPDAQVVLHFQVQRRFPVRSLDDGRYEYTYCAFDDTHLAFRYTSTIGDVLHEVLQCHASGISFTEPRAGPKLDPVMRPEGFRISIRTDWRTGFVHGGGAFNAGTWMDKVGESKRAGNYGIPSTPRDGSPIECTALLAATLGWLRENSQIGDVIVDGKPISIAHWHHLVSSSFDCEYFIPGGAAERHPPTPYRGYYRDVLGGHDERASLQLRPNYLVAIAEVPLS